MNDEAPKPVVRRVADVARERVTWLWPGYLPVGKVVVLDGDPGLGKSTLTADLAARVTVGKPMPDGSGGGEPGAVVLLSAEDGLADTIAPRLELAGADLDLVTVIGQWSVGPQPCRGTRGKHGRLRLDPAVLLLRPTRN